MIKKVLIPFFLFFIFNANAQLNNSWINYSKTYYKFKVGQDGLCRIPYSTLAAIGISTVNVRYFQLWRNGQEVRLYTSISTGIFGPNDYIEFYGEMNDGKPDNQLFRNTDYQLADKYSLETDTAAYFLTINQSNSNSRYTNAINSSPSNATPDLYFMRSIDYYYRSQLNRGDAKLVGEYVYSSSYDKAEGWASDQISPCCDLIKEFTNLHVYQSGPANSLSVKVNMAGCASNDRNVGIKLFQNDITTSPYGSSINMPYFDYRKIVRQNLPLSLLQNNDILPVTISNRSSNSFDRIVVASIGITYPATFSFSNAVDVNFTLPPSANGNYLVIDSFNYGRFQPILLDEISGSRYIGDTASTAGKVKFVLPVSSLTRKLRLLSQSNIAIISTLTQKAFINLSQISNQSDYIIISNPALYDDGNGNNYVDQYRQYRSTLQGGGFNAKVYDANELYDQFGFGIKYHPGAIRDFIRYAKNTFAVTPSYVFIIGRGLDYRDQMYNQGSPFAEKLNLVTTFGWPASDNLLASMPGSITPIIPIGRIGAVSANEVNYYLTKIKEYESAQQSAGTTVDEKGWMKNVLHVVGGKDSSENNQFMDFMNSYKVIAEDTSMGAYVETFTKTSTSAVQQLMGNRIEQLMNEGISFIGYFGHSSANTLEFNLSRPEAYRNQGKYPFFNVSGCSSGNYFIYDQLRLYGSLNLSEKYVLANQRGSIGFLADTHFGIPPYLNNYNLELYNAMSTTMYGNSIGNQMSNVIETLGGNNPALDFFTRIHLEEINLQGDPALKINSFSKPDFEIEDKNVKISPTIISVADGNFDVNIKLYNLGKAVGDSILVTVKQQSGTNAIKVLYAEMIPAIVNTKSLLLRVPINPNTDKGLNKIFVNVDANNRIDEQYETNNLVTKEFYIFEEEIKPVSPSNFSIVNKQNITFVSSTANPMIGLRTYTMEIDTTELFNSGFKKEYHKTSTGGLIEFIPNNIIFSDSTVYYWRVSMVPLNNTPVIWNEFSFIYLPNSTFGYNQSHYYQHLKSSFSNIDLVSDRSFQFSHPQKSLNIKTGLYPFYSFDQIDVFLDQDKLEYYGCINYLDPNDYNNIQFYIFDTNTIKPWRNYNVSATNGRFGSKLVCQNDGTPNDPSRAFFEFNYSNADQRKSAMQFIDSIPNGMYVAITNLGRQFANTTFINEWKADSVNLGSGNSLYHKLKSIGFSKIDSFYKNLPFLYFFKKGDVNFVSTQVMGPKDSSYINKTFALNTTSTDGYIQSPNFGPAKEWTSLHWRGFTKDSLPLADSVNVQVWGIRNNGTSELLSTIMPAIDTSLSFVDTRIFPYIKLVMNNIDKKYFTPFQLRYFRINAMPLPEGAINPDPSMSVSDTLNQGEILHVSVFFKNVSEMAFDSMMKVKFVLTDQYNVSHIIDIPKRKILTLGDTILVTYSFDTRNIQGSNTIFIDFNGDNDQPEQFHFNNFLYKNFFVKKDVYNPLLDVTFDGVHILNRDIVSSKPNVLIKIKDENNFMALSDTSFLSMQVRYPDQSIHAYNFGDTMQFHPANLANGENMASINFTPFFKEDGDYELMVKGRDSVGNPTGNTDYRVLFSVINKPMISNLLNYPNPFTTSTAFVFMVTGSEVPQNIKIQILTVSGKVVKEITKNELGPIHIGRNITEYKWDGTDRYGQKLANGVYLYRVFTNLNGKSLDKFKSENENTDKYFTKGYGKMYLMR